MFKKILLFVAGLTLLFSSIYALDLSRVKTWDSGDILTHTDLNAEFDNILNHAITYTDLSATAAIPGSMLDLTIPGAIGGTTPAAGAFTTLSSTGNTTIGNAAADSLTVNANTIVFEGSTDDTYEQTMVIKSGADSNGILLPTGAVFFMITGSCPTGTTDVTATYSNKFIKINATQGTASGTVLTGTSDSHTLSSTEMPAHTHYDALGGTPSGGGGYNAAAHAGSAADASTSSTGGGGGHTHTLSAATTLEPASITCKLCSVD